MQTNGIKNILINESINTINYKNREFQTINGNDTINLNYNLCYIINTGGTYNINLPTGSYPGEQKTIIVTSNPALASHNIVLLYNDAYGNPQEFIFGQVGDMFIVVSTTLGWQIIYSLVPQAPVVLSLNFTWTDYNGNMLFQGQVVSQGTSPVYSRGVVYNTTGNPTLFDNIIIASQPNGLGVYNISFNNGTNTLYARAYATNSVDTVYGPELSATPRICLAKGTLIRLSNGNDKPIEDINYEDDIKVWNFDEGKFDVSKPLWIKIPETTNEYNLLEFSDGTLLKTINQHRIFNKEQGKFTYAKSVDTPIGTTTFNVSGNEVTLIDVKKIEEVVEYYNIITKYHINIFANGILTSCRYNNIYPITNMKFVKDSVNFNLKTLEDYSGINKEYFEGLRLDEQSFDIKETFWYVNRLEIFKKIST